MSNETDVQLPDGDYELKDGAAWIGTGKASIRIMNSKDGVEVCIYKRGRETEDPVTGAYVLHSELEKQE